MPAPMYWRADGGLQNVPEDSGPSAETLVLYQQYAAMLCSELCLPQWMRPQRFVCGPVGLAGLVGPPVTYASNAAVVSKDDAVESPPPPVEDRAVKKKPNPWAPPKLEPGINYMFDVEHTSIHIFKKAAPIWTEKYRGQTLSFRKFKVSVNFTVKMVIERTLNLSGDDECTGWAVTEVIERGDGVWSQGTTIEYASDKAAGALKHMGWTNKNGDSLPPVWLVVHKPD